MELVVRVKALGVQPIVATINKNFDHLDGFFSTRAVRHYRFERRSKLDFRVVWQLVRVIRNERIDCVQTWQVLSGTYGLLAAKLTNTPLVCSTIRDAKTNNSLYERTCKVLQARFSDVFVANTAIGLSSQFKGWRENFRVIASGIDLDRFQTLDSHRIASLSEKYGCGGAFTIGMVANMRSHRDPFTLLGAVKRLSVSVHPVRLILVGCGELLPQIEDEVRRLGLESIVHIVGYQREVELFIALFDVSVLLVDSKRVNEGVSNFLLESIAMRKVVVATDGGGNLEVITHGETGYLVAPFDIDGLYRCLLKVYETEHREMVEKAQGDLVERYGMARFVEGYYSTYQDVVLRRRSARQEKA
jgi:glycosyltransferase involved in cell wall biosynthesis